MPYTLEIVAAVADPRYKRVVWVCASQMAKTETLLNLAGHRLDDDPAPILFVSPTQRQSEDISRRATKMLRAVPSLWGRVDKSRAGFKVSEKLINGQPFRFAWAGSATELSSHPAALALVDERDRMANDVDGEGDPVSLAAARVATYPDGKVVVCSTPTIEGGSAIWSLFEEGTQHRWSWPCPDCGEYFVPELELLKWPEDATPTQALHEARLACPRCGTLIGDEHRARMNANGRFEITGDPDSTTASFWVSGLCSPWRSFGQAAADYVAARRSNEPGRVQASTNTTFGETFKIEGDAPAADVVESCKGAYAIGDVPASVQRIVAGVDMQANRLIVVIRGFGYSGESWLLDYLEIHGDTSQESAWDELALLLDRAYGSQRIVRMLIDSGYRPQMAYAFARRFRGRVLPSKGHYVQDKPVNLRPVDITDRGRTIKHGVMLAHVSTHYFKQWVYGRIQWPTGELGAWHLPHDVPDTYCAEVVSERLVVRPSGSMQWIKTGPNHALDAEVLCAAAAHLIHADKLRSQAPTETPKAVSTPQQPVVRRDNPFRRRDGATRW